MMTSAPKVVVSSTLDQPDCGPTTLISRDVAAELTKLKQQPGKNITVGASPNPRPVPAAGTHARPGVNVNEICLVRPV
jgi:hypothetical protein